MTRLSSIVPQQTKELSYPEGNSWASLALLFVVLRLWTLVLVLGLAFFSKNFERVLLHLNWHTITVHFKACDLIAFDIFIYSWNHHYCQENEYICQPQKSPVSLGNPHLPCSWAATDRLLSLALYFKPSSCLTFLYTYEVPLIISLHPVAQIDFSSSIRDWCLHFTSCWKNSLLIKTSLFGPCSIVCC